MGINKAIIFQQLHFLLSSKKAHKDVNAQIDGKWWVYNSYPDWQNDYFTWLSIGAIKRLFLELEEDGLVLSKQGVKSKADRRKWYTIDYTRWSQFVTTIVSNCDDTPSEQNDPMDGHNLLPPTSQNEPLNVSKSADLLNTETTTETSTDVNTETPKPP